MKLFPFFGVVFAAKDECLDGMKNSSPEYGGTCWDSWVIFIIKIKNNETFEILIDYTGHIEENYKFLYLIIIYVRMIIYSIIIMKYHYAENIF